MRKGGWNPHPYAGTHNFAHPSPYFGVWVGASWDWDGGVIEPIFVSLVEVGGRLDGKKKIPKGEPRLPVVQ